MSNIIPLIQNENMKIYRRLMTWIMIGIVVIINLIMAIVLYFIEDSPVSHFVEFMSLSANVYLAFLVSIFTIVIAGGIVASEFSWGTVKMLLIRPVSRSKILLSKYIATLLYAIFLIVTIIVSSFIFGLIFFGSSGNTEATIVSMFKDHGLNSIDMIITVTFAFMISTVFRSNALAITLSFVILFFGGMITGILSMLEYNWGKYILFANTDLTQYSEGATPHFEGTTLGFSITVILIYFVIFQLISWYVFNKRDVSV